MTRATVGDDAAHAPNPGRRGPQQEPSLPALSVCLVPQVVSWKGTVAQFHLGELGDPFDWFGHEMR